MFISLKQTFLWIGLLTLGVCAFVLVPKIDAQEKGDRKIVKKVEPTYPPLAGQLHLIGAVKMVLQVTPEGKVASVRTTGGSPILQGAAEGAVKQWKYEAASKETAEMVTITFEAPK